VCSAAGCYANVLAVVAGADTQFNEFEDFFIDNPRTKLGFFFLERNDGTKIDNKLDAVFMWNDQGRRYIRNPYANMTVNDGLLRRIIA